MPSTSLCTKTTNNFLKCCAFVATGAAQGAAGAAILPFPQSDFSVSFGAAAGAAWSAGYIVVDKSMRFFLEDEKGQTSLGSQIFIVCTAWAVATAPLFGTFKALDVPFTGKNYGRFLALESTGACLVTGGALVTFILGYLILLTYRSCLAKEEAPTSVIELPRKLANRPYPLPPLRIANGTEHV